MTTKRFSIAYTFRTIAIRIGRRFRRDSTQDASKGVETARVCLACEQAFNGRCQVHSLNVKGDKIV